MLRDREFLFMNGVDKLGQFQLHYGGQYHYPKTSCLNPVYKIEEKTSQKYRLIPGFLDVDGKFYDSPISVNYLEINEMKYYKEDNSKYLETSLRIFSSDYKSFRNIDIKLESNSLGTGVVDPIHLNDIINTLNIYVQNLNEIDLINESLLQHSFNLKIINSEYILKAINDINFEFFSNDHTRVGKDNTYWNEIILSQLPANSYLMRSFKDIIAKSNIVNEIEIKDDEFFIIYNRDSTWSPTYGRQKIGFDHIKAQEIKDILKYNILKSIDFIQERNYRLKLQ